MTVSGFDLDGPVVGRRTEFDRLEDALAAAARRGGECVLVEGAPGVGKSTLLQAFGADVECRGVVFAHGRSQEGGNVPYSAVVAALGLLARTMRDAPAGERDRWHVDLVALGAGAAPLRALVPDLDGFVTAMSGPTPTLGGVDGRHRLHRAVTRLVEVTASYRPVVLAVDDLQWADPDTVLVLSSLIAADTRNVVVVGAYRAGDFDPAALGAVDPVMIPLSPLSPGDLETLLGALGGRTADLSEVASEFHHRTGGNPLQVRQLVRRAQWEGVLTPPTAEGTVTWDLGALAAMEITPDVADLIGQAVDRLRPADAGIVSALACIGREFDLTEAAAAAGEPLDGVARAIWDALDSRLLDALDVGGRRIVPVIDHAVRYRFSHDRVAETARARLDDNARSEVHLRLGRLLADRAREGLFEAARHLGIGGVHADLADRARYAAIELRAAELARAQSSFALALGCCRTGVALLGDRRWSTHPDLTRELHLAASEAAYLAGDYALMDVLLDEAVQELDDPVDRAHAAYLRLRGLAARHRLQEAMETGLQALAELREPLPRNTGKAQAAAVLIRMRLTMRRWSDDRLVGLPRCQDRRIAEVQRILDALRNISYIVRPALYPFIVRKELDLMLAHGLVSSSPVSVISYGLLLVMVGERSAAQRFGDVGLRLSGLDGLREARPQTQFFRLNFIRPWRHPVRDGLVELRDAIQEALDQGDLEIAGFLGAVLLYQSLWVGRPLAEIDAAAESVLAEVRSHRVTSSLCRCTQQLLLNLMGRTDDPFLLAGESGYDERETLPLARREHDDVALGGVAITKLALHFWCGDDAGGISSAEDAFAHVTGLVGTPNVQMLHLMNALVRIRAAPADRSTTRAVKAARAVHRAWAAEAPANYAAPAALLDGVWALARGDLQEAERKLGAAMAHADAYQLPLMAALAQEEMSEVYARSGRTSLAHVMVRAAHERWTGIGMRVRSDGLEARHPWLRRGGLRGSAPDPAGGPRLAQALAMETTWRGTVEVLLETVADTTGADRVLLVGEPDRPDVRAVLEGGAVTMMDGSTDPGHDPAIVREAVRAPGPVMATAADGVVLAVPVLLRGRTIGVVVAERRGTGSAFGPDAPDAVTAVCAQAAASLWSFELEGRLAEADEQRQSLIAAQSRFIPGELLRILDVDDISRVRRGYRVERTMTVLISDIRGYTSLLEGMDVAEASDVVMGFLLAVELPIITSNGLLQDVRGDEILAVFDVSPDDAVRAGLAMLRSLGDHNRERTARGAAELRVGIGINTGPVALGLVGGVNRMALSVIGDAVNLAARVEGTTKRYRANLLISQETYAGLVHPERFAIRRMERVMVVNRRQPVTVHEVYDDDPEPLREAKREAQPAFDEAFAAFDAGDTDRARKVFERCRELLPDDEVAPLHLLHCDARDRGETADWPGAVLGQK